MMFRCLVLAFLFLLVANGQVHADFIVNVTPGVTSVPDGFAYDYAVNNPLSNLDDGIADLVFYFSVDVNPLANLLSVVTPIGWSFVYREGDPLIEWIADDFPYGILPGDTLVFGFSSGLGPGTQLFTALALNEGGVDLASGTTLGPAVDVLVPEPSGILLTIVALCCVAAYLSVIPVRHPVVR